MLAAIRKRDLARLTVDSAQGQTTTLAVHREQARRSWD